MEVELTSFVPNVAGTFNLTYTPTQSEVKVKILGTGGSTSIIGWHNLQIWKPQMVQEEVLVDICEKDNDRYMFGFNGMEKDNEMKGIGNSLDFGARMHDSRIGRWLSLDPALTQYPQIAPFVFVANSPLYVFDKDGKRIFINKGKNQIEYTPGTAYSGKDPYTAYVWQSLDELYKLDGERENIDLAISAVDADGVAQDVFIENNRSGRRTPNGANYKKGSIKYDPFVGYASKRPGPGTRFKKQASDYLPGIIRPFRSLGHEIRHFLSEIGKIETPEPVTSDEKKERDNNRNSDDWNRVKEDDEITEKNQLSDPKRNKCHDCAEPVWTDGPTSDEYKDNGPSKERESQIITPQTK